MISWMDLVYFSVVVIVTNLEALICALKYRKVFAVQTKFFFFLSFCKMEKNVF